MRSTTSSVRSRKATTEAESMSATGSVSWHWMSLANPDQSNVTSTPAWVGMFGASIRPE